MSSEPTLDNDTYNAILAQWLQTPSVSRVALALGLSRSVVKQAAKEGVPELGLPPLPLPTARAGSKKKNATGLTNVKSRAAESSYLGDAPPDESFGARVMIVKEETDAIVTQLKAKLQGLEDEAKKLGVKADVAEARQRLNGTLEELEVVRKKVDLETAKIQKVERAAVARDTVQRSAEEAVGARVAMSNCLAVGAIMSLLSDKLLEAIEKGKVALPDVVHPRDLATLAVAADRLTTSLERAIKIERGRAGEPDQVLGVQLGLLLNGLSNDELDEVASSGRLPTRLRLLAGGGDDVG